VPAARAFEQVLGLRRPPACRQVLERWRPALQHRIGDTTHFAREDEVEAAWAIVDPVLQGGAAPLEYLPGSWGPPQAENLLKGSCGWHNPGAQPQDWTRSCGRTVPD